MASLEMHAGLRRIGEYLPCPRTDIEWALSVQAMESASGHLSPLGEILVGRELLAQETLAEALKSQLMDRLRLTSLLADLSGDDLALIGTQTCEIVLEAGDTLFRQENRGDSVYVMIAGRLILSRLVGQTEDLVGVAIPGDTLGEEEYFTGGPRGCSAYALERSVLMKIHYDLIPWRAPVSTQPVFLAAPAQFASRACAVFRADRAYFFIRDPKTGDLTEQGEGAAQFKIASGTGLIGWVALNREIVNLPEAHLDPRFDPSMDIQTNYRTRTLLAAPIVNNQNEVQGVLEVVNKRAGQFDSDDEVVLQAFAKQCAAALHSGA